MKKYDIVILTEKQYENPSKINQYVKNVLYEDKLLQHALESKGLKVIRKDWASDFDWTSTKSAIFRATWDYFHRFAAFTEWLSLVSTKTTLINSADIISWNMDKRYLKELMLKDINIPSTTFIETGTTTSLEQLHSDLGWTTTILKPTVAGSARHTYKLNQQNMVDHESIFQELISHETMMLQTFQHNLVDEGEMSLVMIDGEFTHAVIKKAKEGEFRVQDDFGGSVAPYSPTEKEIAFAQKTINACPTIPIYARVDIFYDNEGAIALGEIELIEPELWFRHAPFAAKKLADAIINTYFSS